MNQWQNGQADGMFNQQTPTHLNPSMFSNLNAAGQFDLNGASPYQQQQGLANGNANSGNNNFQNAQSFQTGSVVPQKRPHDGGMSGSPPPPNQTSRSATPNFNAFANPQQAQQFNQGGTPTPYSHLQQTGSAQATPSPTMSNQQFRGPARMPNASPSPFPQQGQGNFTGQMGNANAQAMGQQMNNMGQFNMNATMAMNANNMATSMPTQSNGMNAQMLAQQQQQQRQYQMRLMQQQAAMRQQHQNGGAMPNASATPTPNNMMNMAQVQNAMQNRAAMQQQQQIKRQQFLQQCGAYVAKTGRSFSANHSVQGKPLDLYNLFTCVVSAGGSGAVDRGQQWPAVAAKLGFDATSGSAALEIKNIFLSQIALYEKAWMNAKASQKQEQARLHAQQMAGFAASGQASPTKTMQPLNNQMNVQGQPQTFNQFQQQPPTQTSTPQPPQQATPVQANASLPQNGGVSTPQSMANAQHRRNSSMRKPGTMTPQPPAPSPQVKAQHSPPIKRETLHVPLKKTEKQSTVYEPSMRTVDKDGGYDTAALFDLGTQIHRLLPQLPVVAEMGIVDTRAITLSLASGIHAEVRYALDTLVAISSEAPVSFQLEKCEDLFDVLVDCAEAQTDSLADKTEEVSNSIDLLSYEAIIRLAKTEAEALQDVAKLGTPAWDLDRAAERLLSITTILRNCSFYEHNHRVLTQASIIKWISHTLRLVGTRHMFMRTYLNLQDLYKDIVVFLSNITQSLELPSRDDALHIVHFLVAFAPEPVPVYTGCEGKLTFRPFDPTIHNYLPPAVDSLAKLLARQDPNRSFYKSIFSASNGAHNEEDPTDLLTRAFALSISVIPDRVKHSPGRIMQLRIVEVRKPYLAQGMLAADVLSTFLPSGESAMAKAWLESSDGWPSSLLSLASLLSVDNGSAPPPNPRQPQQGWDFDAFRLITHHALEMMKRLTEKSGHVSARRLANGNATHDGEVRRNGAADEVEDHTVSAKKWLGIPQRHVIIGAMKMRGVDAEALKLLCNLHDLATQA